MLSIDETIAKEKANAEKLRKIIETGYDGEISIEALFCDDTDAIKEAYERFENCAEEHEQLAEWLEELKTIKEMDLSIPQHFTKEQSDWIKAYCIKRNIESYNEDIDDLIAKCENAKFAESDEIALSDIHTGVNSGLSMSIHFAEQLKVGGKKNDL